MNIFTFVIAEDDKDLLKIISSDLDKIMNEISVTTKLKRKHECSKLVFQYTGKSRMIYDPRKGF